MTSLPPNDLAIDEACAELGVQIGDSQQTIKAAYRKRVRQTHPDQNPGLDGTAFMRVRAAYERLRQWMAAKGTWDVADSDNNSPTRIICRETHFDERIFEDEDEGVDDNATEDGDSALDVTTYVAAYFANTQIEILFDGSLHEAGALRMASKPDEIGAYLDVDLLDFQSIEDDVVLQAKRDRMGFPAGDIRRALRRFFQLALKNRKKQISEPLLAVLTPDAAVEAEAAWLALAKSISDLDPVLVVAILKHFIWQIKQKLLDRSVMDHLMPVIWSAQQGTGKTTFVRAFLRPLRELATHPVALADVVDLRSGDIFRFPAVFVDDMSAIAASLVADFKSMLTARELRRRVLGSSMSCPVRQRATFIGTSNRTIEHLIIDDTGHRRFAMIPFRNGDAVKGGDRTIWDVVENTDYELLWRSVDVFAASPIKPQLAALHAHQAHSRRKDPLLEWLLALDFDSEPVRNIHHRDGFPSRQLWQLYCEQTGSTMTEKAFGLAMKRYDADPQTPIWQPPRSNRGQTYRIERGAQRAT